MGRSQPGPLIKQDVRLMSDLCNCQNSNAEGAKKMQHYDAEMGGA